MKSKTKIRKQTEKKTNPELVETIRAAGKNEHWMAIARILSGSRNQRTTKNLNDLEKEAGKENVLIVPGKILSDGEITKKAKIAALNFSDKAKERLLKAGCDVKSILEEIKNNPSAKGIKILK